MSTASVAGGARVGRGASIILGGLTLGAWVAVFAGLEADGAGIVGFVAAWTVMMVAMMLPSGALFVLLYRRGARPEATTHIGRRSVPLRFGPLAARVSENAGTGEQVLGLHARTGLRQDAVRGTTMSERFAYRERDRRSQWSQS